MSICLTEEAMDLAVIQGLAQRQSRQVYPCSKSTYRLVFLRTMYSTSSVLSRAKRNSRSSRWNKQLPRRWIKSLFPCGRCSWSVCLFRKQKAVVAIWQITRRFLPCDFRSLSMTWRGAEKLLLRACMETQSCSKLSSLSSESSCTLWSSKMLSRVAGQPMEEGKVGNLWRLRTLCRMRIRMKIMNCASESTPRPAQSTR